MTVGWRYIPTYDAYNDDQMVMYHGERVCVLQKAALKHHKLKNGMELNMAINYNEYRTKGTTTDVLVGRDITAIILAVWDDGRLVTEKRLDYVV